MIKEVPLNQRLRHIGFRITYQALDVPLGSLEIFQCDIERTLIDAAYEARGDGRLRSLLFSWFSVHADRIIVEKFFKFTAVAKEKRGHNPIVNALAVYAFINGDHRFKKYIKKTPANEYIIDKDEIESFGKIHGFKEDWLALGVKVSKKMIRIREEDVLTITELSRQNLQFRNRLLIGTCWRADIITAIENGAETPAEIKKRIGCSYEPAHRVFQEYGVYAGALKVATDLVA